jgi:hypothetical protein
MLLQGIQNLLRKENKAPKMKGEIGKICGGLIALYKGAIIPKIRWNFIFAGCKFNPDNLLVL